MYKREVLMYFQNNSTQQYEIRFADVSLNRNTYMLIFDNLEVRFQEKDKVDDF